MPSEVFIHSFIHVSAVTQIPLRLQIVMATKFSVLKIQDWWVLIMVIFKHFVYETFLAIH